MILTLAGSESLGETDENSTSVAIEVSNAPFAPTDHDDHPQRYDDDHHHLQRYDDDHHYHQQVYPEGTTVRFSCWRGSDGRLSSWQIRSSP